MGKCWVLGAVFTLACGDTTTSHADAGGTGARTTVSTTDAGHGGSHVTPSSDGGAGRSSDADASAGTDASSICGAGEEGCACYGNKTCNAGLTCASNLCVNLSAPDAASGAGGAASGGKGGAGGAQGGAGGVRGDGGVAGAHQCFGDQIICNADPAGCCLGLLCVSATGAPNSVCTPVCVRDNDCASGCCAPLTGSTDRACAPEQYCAGSCIQASGSCTSAVSACCAGTRCVYDDATTATASCAAVCQFDTDCASGCCAPLSDGSASVCSDTRFCAGACLAAGTRPCGLGTPCCPGSYCTSDATNQICLPLCSTNADCVSGCCAVPNGNGVHVCTDPAFCP